MEQNRNRRWEEDDQRNYQNDDRRRNNQNEDRGFGNVGGYGGNYEQNERRSNYRGGNQDSGDTYFGDGASGFGMGNYPNQYSQSQSRGNGYRDDNRRWDGDRGNPGYGGQGNSGNYSSWNNNRHHDRNRNYDNNNDRNWWDRTKDEVSSWFGDDDAERRRRMDEQRERISHRGKGPKDYKRSDDRIREDISDRLSDDHDVDASNIEIQVSGSEVTLSGTVDSRQAKRRAEDLADSVSGVSHVQNNLRVSVTNSAGSASNAGNQTQPLGSSMKAERMHHN